MTTYHADGAPLGIDGFEYARAILGVDAATLWAVLHVETRGFGYLPSRRPVIRFERHVFHDLTGGRFDQEHPDLSHAEPGGYLGGAGEYARLDGASALDADAALQSTSWGIGHILGLNYQYLGYNNVQQMVDQMVGGEDDQLWAATAFIEDCTMNDALRAHAWAEFTAWCHGAGAGHNRDAKKLAAAFERFQARLPDLDVRFGQVALFYLGFDPGPIDGIMGPRTRAAVIAFQRRRRFRVNGRLDTRMLDTLCMLAFAD